MILYNPKDHPDNNLPSKKLLDALARRGIDPAIFFGQGQEQHEPPRVHYRRLYHLDYHENIFSQRHRLPGTVMVTVNPRVVLLRFNNLCSRPDTIRSEAFFLAGIILQNSRGEDWVLSLN